MAALHGAANNLAKHHGREVAAQWLAAAAQDIGMQIAGPPIRRRSAFLRVYLRRSCRRCRGDPYRMARIQCFLNPGRLSKNHDGFDAAIGFSSRRSIADGGYRRRQEIGSRKLPRPTLFDRFDEQTEALVLTRMTDE
jgi:hypothetical protein